VQLLVGLSDDGFDTVALFVVLIRYRSAISSSNVLVKALPLRSTPSTSRIRGRGHRARRLPRQIWTYREERAMSSEEVAPETRGVAVTVLATVDLAGEIEGMAGRELRMRMVTIEPGGVLGPVHDHDGRPGTVYILQGTITDHRNGVTTDYGPGVGWPEDRNTTHWLENRGTIPAVEISVDIVRQE
jgi:quercetin dioxygenase-like cupin family protein